ncbi:DAO [Bugula neritina]|uniref:DAO n=1 Tax=Bugula neritina TaxID=10212 RepID=A0A7J7KT65_BUGNE|nr:DAO [Bugula neritina]
MWDEYDIIVNCTGLSAGQLTGDPSIVPSRGQVMRVDNSSGKHTFAYIDNGTERMPYYIWTPDYTVIGGTKLIGCTDSQVSQNDHDLIIENCRKYFPWLNVVEDRIREEVVGFRPSRPAIRLEEEHICYKGANKWIVHNYGHCAHGIAYSWGSAHVAVELVIDILQRSKL